MNAILCGRLRSGGETGLWPAAMPFSGIAGAGAVLRAFANQSEPIPSPWRGLAQRCSSRSDSHPAGAFRRCRRGRLAGSGRSGCEPDRGGAAHQRTPSLCQSDESDAQPRMTDVPTHGFRATVVIARRPGTTRRIWPITWMAYFDDRMRSRRRSASSVPVAARSERSSSTTTTRPASASASPAMMRRIRCCALVPSPQWSDARSPNAGSHWRPSMLDAKCSVIGVRTKPGCMQTAITPLPSSSLARVSVNRAIPAFAAANAETCSRPSSPRLP